MLTKRAKLFTGGCLLLGILFCVTGIVAAAQYQKSMGCLKERSPLRSFAVTIDRDEQNLLIEQSKEFANKHGLKFDIAYYAPRGDIFLIEMRRKDIQVIINNNSFHVDQFDVDFLNYDCIHPTVASNIEGLVSDLRSGISEIPSAKITEKK